MVGSEERKSKPLRRPPIRGGLGPGGRSRPRRRRWHSGTAAGLLVALAVLGVGVTATLQRPERWSATSALLVQPRASGASADTLASLYDTLSRGQIPATYAELLRAQGVEKAAEDRAAVSAADRPGVSVTVSVVADTAILNVVSTAPSATTAIRVADAVAEEAQSLFSASVTPYTVTLASWADGSAQRSGLGAVKLLGVTGFAALMVGLAVQQAWAAVVRSRRWGQALSGDWPDVLAREQIRAR